MNREHIFSIVTSLILFASVPLVLAWTGPSANPPNGNVPAPINVSNAGQLKTGFLNLYGPAAGLGVSPNSSYEVADNLLIGANGDVGARRYCNETGKICKSIEELIVNNTNINNATTTGCVTTQNTYTANAAVTSNTGNQVSKEIAILEPGTWTVNGSGTANRTEIQGSMSVWIRVSKNGIVDNNNLFLLKKATVLTGVKPTYPASMTWEVPTTTFTITGSEKVVVTTARASVGGSLTITGPKTVCN